MTRLRKTRPAKSTPRAALNPRKHPRQQRATATVEAILEAAADILETEGFEGYNTNAIAARAGASIGSLYQYFPNKAALTRALIAREDAALLSDLTQLLTQPEGLSLLRSLIRVAVTHQLRRPILGRLLDAEEARLPPSDEKRQLNEVLTSIFYRCFLDTLEPTVLQDLFAIIHGMVDVAGQRGESDIAALASRVERGVFGYVEKLAR